MNKAIIYDFDTLLNTQRWLDAAEAADRLIQKHPKKVLTIRFEDFISDERATLQKICKFFDIKFSTKMLDIKKSAEAKSIASRSALWESNTFPPIKSNVDKFKQTLTVSEIEIIETLVGHYMDRYGYARTTPGKATISDSYWTTARINSEERKRAAWEALRKDRPQDYILRRRRADYIEMCRKNLGAN